MRKVYNYGNVPFDDADISLEDVVAFTSDHLQRAAAYNPSGALNGRIAATASALAALESTTTDDAIQLGIRKGVKLAKDTFRANLTEAVRPIYGAVLMAFNDPSPEMENVFPKGRSVFSSARDDQLAKELNVMVAGVTLHQAELGPPIVASATALGDQWAALYEASETETGVKVATEAERRKARLDLQTELYITLATLMIMYPRQPEMISLYMQQHLLDGKSGGISPGVGAEPPDNSGGSSSVGSTGSTSTVTSSSGSTSGSTSSMSQSSSGSSQSTSSSAMSSSTTSSSSAT